MIWGGTRAKAGKKTQRLFAREKKQPGRKKTQLNNLEEKQFISRLAKKKNSSAGWPGKKKLISRLARNKKLNTNSLPEPPPPDH